MSRREVVLPGSLLAVKIREDGTDVCGVEGRGAHPVEVPAGRVSPRRTLVAHPGRDSSGLLSALHVGLLSLCEDGTRADPVHKGQ